MMGAVLEALLTPQCVAVILGSAVYGLVAGAIPGFTASMAAALVVPVTYFLDPVPALAGIVTLSAMAIFSGDIPGALLRIPGTPASAAYTEEMFQLCQKGQVERALGTALLSSAIGGVAGAVALIFMAPLLAKVALLFSSFEYFWLACLGLTAAAYVTSVNPIKGFASLFIGLAIALVGLDPVAGFPRFTFGSTHLLGGLGFIPVLIGLFAVSQVFRYALHRPSATRTQVEISRSSLLQHLVETVRGVIRFRWAIARGAGIGVVVGTVPGAGADIASYLSYAVSRARSREDAHSIHGAQEAIASATAANNASLGGALVPATVLGIPGDSLTAIIIGVLFMKGLNPGPLVFVLKADLIMSVFVAFLLANVLLVPLGFLAIFAFRHLVAIPQRILIPLILAACIVGAFAVENSNSAVIVMLAMGLIGLYLEENDFPLAPVILGVILGPILEEKFLISAIKAGGDLTAFFDRPVAMGLGICVLGLWGWLLFSALRAAMGRNSEA